MTPSTERPRVTIPQHRAARPAARHQRGGQKSSRWLVSFRSGPGWYPVGEFVAPDATAAIETAVEVFGPGAGHRAEEVL